MKLGFTEIFPDRARDIVLAEVKAGRRVYVCRWGESRSKIFEGRKGIIDRIRDLRRLQKVPVILVTEQTVVQLVDPSGENRSLLWWRWKLGMLGKIDRGIYGYERVS